MVNQAIQPNEDIKLPITPYGYIAGTFLFWKDDSSQLRNTRHSTSSTFLRVVAYTWYVCGTRT
jgi:hypothetical protein